MQKKIVALAVAGLSTAAFAQTNVTIYGVADLSGQGISQSNVKDGTASANGYNGGSVFALQSNSSLIGFKGTEDLGNGLKALFQYETGVNLAGQTTSAQGTHNGSANFGASGLFGGTRDTYVGLNSKYGTVLGGYVSTPFRSSITSFAVEPGATGSMTIEKQMGSMRFGNAGVTFSSAIRATAVAYQMPTLYGFDASIAYTGSNNNGTNNSSSITGGCGEGEQTSACTAAPQSAWGFNLGWTGYGVNIKGAFQQANNNFNSATVAGLGNVGQIGDYTSYLVGAMYTGVPGLKLSTVYTRNTLGTNGSTGAAGTNTLTAGGAGKITNNQLYAGVGYRWGNWEPTVSATWSSDADGSDVQQLGSRQWQLRTGYYLSKRTQVYGLISNLNNSANQNFTFGQQTSQLGANQQTTGSNLFTYGMGMRTSF